MAIEPALRQHSVAQVWGRRPAGMYSNPPGVRAGSPPAGMQPVGGDRPQVVVEVVPVRGPDRSPSHSPGYESRPGSTRTRTQRRAIRSPAAARRSRVEARVPARRPSRARARDPGRPARSTPAFRGPTRAAIARRSARRPETTAASATPGARRCPRAAPAGRGSSALSSASSGLGRVKTLMPPPWPR